MIEHTDAVIDPVAVQERIAAVAADYEGHAQNLQAEASRVLEAAQAECEARMAAAREQAANLSAAARIQAETARQLKIAAQQAMQRSAEPVTPEPKPPMSERIDSVRERLAAFQASSSAVGAAAVNGEGPPSGLVGPAPGGEAPFQPGP